VNESTTKNALKGLKSAHKALMAIGLETHSIPATDFWSEHANFVSLLKDFLYENPSWTHSVSRKDVFYIISLASCYRPKDPQAFLSGIAIQYPNINDIEGKLT